MRQAGRRLTTLLAVSILGMACSSDDPLDEAAQDICDAIDAEASDEAAFEGFELAVARVRRAGVDEDELRAAVDERCGRAVSAIAATAAERDEEEAVEEPEPEPEPESEPEPVDLRAVEWAEQRWSTDCTLDGETQSLPLVESVDGEPGVYSHFLEPGNTLSGMVYSMGIGEGIFSDGSDDERQLAVFRGRCFLGNDFLILIEAWSHDEDGDLLQLPNLLSYSKWDGLIEHVEIVGGQIRVHTSEPAPGEETPHLNGYAVEVVTDWSYGDDGWMADEISRVDTTPEPKPQPAPAPEPAPAPAPREPTACERIGIEDAGPESESYCQSIEEQNAHADECIAELVADPNFEQWEDSPWLFDDLQTGGVVGCAH